MNRTIVLMVSVLSLLACNNRTAEEKPADVSREPVYVDVRTGSEFAGGHVDGALNIPHDQMELRYRELEPYRNQRIIVYCRSGRRSQVALDVLRAKGFTNVENGGAFEDLIAAGVKTAN